MRVCLGHKGLKPKARQPADHTHKDLAQGCGGPAWQGVANPEWRHDGPEGWIVKDVNPLDTKHDLKDSLGLPCWLSTRVRSRKIPHVAQQLSPCATTSEPVL